MFQRKLTQIMKRPAVNGVTDVLKGKLNLFVYYKPNPRIFVSTFSTGLQYRTTNTYRFAISAFHDHFSNLHNQGTVLFGMFRQ